MSDRLTGVLQMKMKLLSECEAIKDKTISSDKLVVRFCGKDEQPELASVSFLPVHIHSCPLNFSTVNYFEVNGDLSTFMLILL